MYNPEEYQIGIRLAHNKMMKSSWDAATDLENKEKQMIKVKFNRYALK